ncbi:MAG: PD-(D/E)XK nuclease family protein [archaeon]
MDTNATLEADLRALERKWERITDVPDSPRPTMDVIEYSLGSQKKAEVYVNRLLAYLLDPEEPHGMGTEFLRAVLEGLPAECDFQEDVHDLSDVVVTDQARVEKVVDGTTESSGIVDLLIEVPNEWFLMVELPDRLWPLTKQMHFQSISPNTPTSSRRPSWETSLATARPLLTPPRRTAG